MSLFTLNAPAHARITPQSAEAFNLVFDAYAVVNIDEFAATPRYYGYLRLDGAWYISKEETATGVKTYTFAKGSSGFSTNWTNRAVLSYDTFDAVFSSSIQ